MKYIILVVVVITIGLMLSFQKKNKEVKSDLIEVGETLFPEHFEEFKHFFNFYLNDKKSFIKINKDLLEEYDNFDRNNLTPIEVIYIFGDSHQKIMMTDWHGEENEREIESFIEKQLGIKLDWKNTNKLRESNPDEETHRDGEFIIKLLKTIDLDLKQKDKQLIFYNLGWDAYVYSIVSSTKSEDLINQFSEYFYGSEVLE